MITFAPPRTPGCPGAACSLPPPRYIDKLSIVSFVWLILPFLATVIVIPSVAPVKGIYPVNGQVQALRQTGSWVWATNPNFLSADTKANGVFQKAGLPSRGAANAYTICNGFLMSQYLILFWDVPGHMAEEIRRPRRNVPRAMLLSFFLGGWLNFGLLLSYLYSVTNINNATIGGACLETSAPLVC